MEFLREARRNFRRFDATRYAYKNVPDYLLQCGSFFKPQALPDDVRLLVAHCPPKRCYVVSFTLSKVWKTSLRYVEGWALSRSGSPIEHAWCIDEHDVVVDGQWGVHADVGAAYFGIVFETTKMGRKPPYIDDFKRRHPLLKRVLEQASGAGRRTLQSKRPI